VRLIHMKTLHLGPEELLVAAKIAVDEGSTAEQVAAAIDAAESRIRAAEPTATAIYLEPDIYRADHEPTGRPPFPASDSH
jgi:divalent metal cation (Fe/Co/Zn/Cd) transporter